MLDKLPPIVRLILAFAAIGFIVVYGQKLAAIVSKRVAP